MYVHRPEKDRLPAIPRVVCRTVIIVTNAGKLDTLRELTTALAKFLMAAFPVTVINALYSASGAWKTNRECHRSGEIGSNLLPPQPQPQLSPIRSPQRCCSMSSVETRNVFERLTMCRHSGRLEPFSQKAAITLDTPRSRASAAAVGYPAVKRISPSQDLAGKYRARLLSAQARQSRWCFADGFL